MPVTIIYDDKLKINKGDSRLRLIIIAGLSLPFFFFFFGFKPYIFFVWLVVFLISIPFDLWWFGTMDRLRQDVTKK